MRKEQRFMIYAIADIHGQYDKYILILLRQAGKSLCLFTQVYAIFPRTEI